MGDRFWADADYAVSTEVYSPQAEDHPDEDAPLVAGQTRRWALEIGGDYALVVDGSLDQFEVILRRALAKVTAAKSDSTTATGRDLP